MKFVALLSGGKDSVFNILHCIQNGHELVAAATLGPKPGQGQHFILQRNLWAEEQCSEEIDSFMYQTVGQDAVHLVAEALDVVLYRRTIEGNALEQGAEYGKRDNSASGVTGDETEDLYALLSQVKVRALQTHSVWTIWLRTRKSRNITLAFKASLWVPFFQIIKECELNMCACILITEYCSNMLITTLSCRRLSLTCLCYLWQRKQNELLSEMVEAGMQSVLIKVAGIGLSENHLGKSLAQMQPTLTKLVSSLNHLKMTDSHSCQHL